MIAGFGPPFKKHCKFGPSENSAGALLPMPGQDSAGEESAGAAPRVRSRVQLTASVPVALAA